MILLTVRSGLSKGASWPIGERPLVVGRESGCDVRIPDPVVSRQHCEIVFDGKAIRLRDLGSLNLVMVNGRPVSSCTLEVGDEIRIGRVIFFVTQSVPEEPAVIDSEDPYSTDTLAENESVFLSSPSMPDTSVSQAQTDSDLNELFRLSRSLSRINREADLVQAVGEAINTHFAPDHGWFFAFDDGDERLTPLPGRQEDAGRPPGREWIMNTLRGRQGTLTPKRITVQGNARIQCVLAAPVFFGQHEIGVLMFQRTDTERCYQKRDLHFFVALAHVVAPFFKAIERIEALEAENQRLQLPASNAPR